MKAKIIDGRAIASKIVAAAREKIARPGAAPVVLVSVVVGDDPSVASYVITQKKVCAGAGILHETVKFDSTIAKRELLSEITRLNAEYRVTGVIINLPLPERISSYEVQSAVSGEKDAEGLNPANLGNLMHTGAPRFVHPCAASAVMECIKHSATTLKGKEVVIVGHGDVVGKPLAAMLLSSKISAPTVTVCNITTRDLASHTRRADVLVVAAGKAGLVTRDMVKDGAVVIDVGINTVELIDDRGQKIIDPKTGLTAVRIVGDVAFDEVAEAASAITPVPGGVGPVTSAMLVRNMVSLASVRRPKQQ
ncbi:MAG: bifunctional 5,10-methylene-tetrahydrofolate dehydrogenase/5,10-methylene-tetrahydrofolate cyclohydrolase [Elusimicrobia bacterium HGW-Elusimicrobia-1]|jgi:methylenetetrahydrofolate dehydrogenase (NADP+)/methenyltetrahydrofolate cyclohydrolase|nr:MAG: bifunctional 5,10-methylene-tetrahydrofolate dehydrogenase/5,10-methylene-tetrahydrofolate cyclohydrolase [Elusimicrobia bacterium HGW-Elusimicrobia-1]